MEKERWKRREASIEVIFKLFVDFFVSLIVESLIFEVMGEMNWVQRKIYLYNVTFGLYMLDSWERYSFNTLVIVLIWFVLRYFAEFFKSARYVW
ncbi:unnamed protein product [Lupinus luteus]|uniref:Uncharacterized protein n=1 Tax=Lupinus luteus TaxID=3873 RepID=A0AAV1W6F4_LUPLU